MPETKNIPMYRAIHYDRKSGTAFMWYTDGAKEAFRAKHVFYTPNYKEFGSMESGMTDIHGNPVYACVTDSEKEFEIKNNNKGKLNHISECDIEFRTRFLERHYSGIDELRFVYSDFNIGFIDIEVETGDKFPSPRRADRRINCITLFLTKARKYITFGLQKDLKPETYKKINAKLGAQPKESKLTTARKFSFEYRRFETEQELLEDLFSSIGESDIDVLSGWNSEYFDIPYILKRAEILDINIRPMSRLPDKFKQVYVDKKNELYIGGTELIDYLKLYKKFSRGERDNYKLDTIAFDELGERKAPLPDGYHSYKNYWDDYVYYNIMDVDILVRIDEKRKMMESLIGACSEARVPFCHFFQAKKMLVGFLLNYLHKRNIVMPPLKENEKKKFPGAYVYTNPGYYKNLVNYDYRSMYPSIIMGANISPEMKVEFPIGAKVPEHILNGYVKSPWDCWGTKQVFYRKDVEGIIPGVVRILFDGRTELKNKMKHAEREGRLNDKDYYDMKQNAYKILGNALYGLLGNPHFQFYDLDNAASVTAYGYKLITSTIEKFTNYMETDFPKDKRFTESFGYTPPIDPANSREKRLSHGDTDSFFVKYGDFYAPFSANQGKKVEIVVINKNKVVEKTIFNIPDGEKDSKICFNKACLKYTTSWKTTTDDKKKEAFAEEIFVQGDMKIIYNTYTLTSFCRILDYVLLEDLFADIMQQFSDYWSFRENTLYLKREKCIQQAIVTAKKKYICNVESNEDIYQRDKKTGNKKPKFSTTGVEIVRSSTLQFSREKLQELVVRLLVDFDKTYIREETLKIKEQFFKLVKDRDVYSISIPSGVKKNPPLLEDLVRMDRSQRKLVDWRLRAASVWNYLIENDPVLSTQPFEPIYEGSKVKFLKIHKNRYGVTCIAYTGESCPQRLLDVFFPDWNTQWNTGFANVIGRLFVAVGWSKNLENDMSDLVYDAF